MGLASFRWSSAARYGLPGLVLGLVASMALGGDRTPKARAQAPQAAEASGTIAFTTATPGTYPMLYLIDTKARAFAIYRVDSTRGTVQLQAARQYAWDLQLREFNSQGPDVAAIEAMVTAAATSKPQSPR